MIHASVYPWADDTPVYLHQRARSLFTTYGGGHRLISPIVEYPSARLEGWVEGKDKVRADAYVSAEENCLAQNLGSANSQPCAPPNGLPCPI
jgi:hypothetical protein